MSAPLPPGYPPGSAMEVVSQLEGMGFSPDAAFIALQQHGWDLDEALQWLFDNPGVGEQVASPSAGAGAGAPSSEDFGTPFGVAMGSAGEGEAKVSSGGGGGGGDDDRDEFGGYFESREARHEFEMQVGMAESILHANEEGQLPPAETAIVPWAELVMELKRTLLLRADPENARGNLATSDAAIAELRNQLRVEKVRVDLVVARAIEAENQRLKLQLEHDRARKEQYDEMMRAAPKQDQEIDALLRKAEELQSEAEEYRTIAHAYMKPPVSLSKKHFEDVYGFLKELVHNEQDLETHRERIHAYIVVERVGEDNAAVVPDLLDLLSVEDELVKVNRQIQAALTDGGSSSSSVEANGGEGGSGSGNYDGEDDPQKLLSTELEALGASSEAQESALEEALARAKRDPGNAIFSGLGGSSGYDGAPENGQAMEHGLLSGTSKRHQALCHAA